ncbi:expressed unknown protein [Seminavis robusta]|uniref:Uncharacterized protein n=1 Tax=Seminavis robusta TaxID=568900 RepID=A0A9N8HF18_9STRA|nr:expressed unknown protein [Seminavis robusta]|eukprot:Sro411_g137650.1 n/a (93) ;mRNA; f:32960-33335
MMKNLILILVALFLASASAFAPQPFVRESHSVCFAKHVNDKAAKWAASKRPKKSRPSDINKTPPIYELHSIQKPSEFTISDAPATPVTKPEG